MTENAPSTHSSEEMDHLVRNTKKQKSTSADFCPQQPIKSYRDSLTYLSLD